DLPSARKIGGFAGPTAAHLCNLCWLPKSEKGNFNCETWRSCTYEEYFAAAVQWQDAKSQKEHNNIFKKTGVRWSELLRLPYWD
ncbi:hypothetical protein OG21DRAFT_1367454, partial [Imleria badia]